MATTAAKLRAVVTAETTDGQKKLRQFGDEVSGLRRTTEKEVNAIAAVFKGTLSAGLVLGGLHAAANALGSILSGLWNTARQVMGDAYAAVRDYEMLALGLRQLTASQIVGAGVTSDMAEALKLAEEPAKRLIGWIEKLAVKSPFTSAEVAAAFRMAEAFGFTEGQARRLTAALTDFSAGAGLSGDYINRIMLNLGQMQAQGKVTSREIRDLAMAGLPVKNILAESFGVTQAKMAEMLEDGAVPVGKALESIVNFLETRFAGAAERTTQTWQGLQSSLQDIRQIDLRELFGGVFEAIRPEAAQIVDFLASDEFRGKLRAVGITLGDSVKAGVAAGKQALKGLFDAGFLGEAGDFLNQIKGGSFAQSVQKLVGAIEFGVMSAAVEVKAVGSTLWEVGKFIAEVLREFLARLGGLVTIFGSVIDTKSNAIITRMEAALRGNVSPTYNKLAATAAEEAALASGNLADYVGSMGDEIVSSYDDMLGRIQAVNAQRNKEREAVAAARQEYERLTTAMNAPALGPESPAKGWVNPFTGKGATTGPAIDPRVEQVLSGNSFNTNMAAGGETAGKKIGDAIEDAIDRAVKRGNYTDDVLKYIDVEKLRAAIQGDANAEASQARLAKLIGADANTLKALTGQDLAGKGVVLSDADAQAMAASLKAGVMSGLDKVAAEQPTVIQSLLGAAAGGGQPVDFGGTLVPAIVKAVDAELVANGKQLEERGGQAWTLMETGFIAKAKQSAAFALAVEAMVENSLKQYLPTN